MPSLVLVDTCTLLNFVAVARLDLLAATLDGGGRWTEAAAREMGNAAEEWPWLWSVDLADWLGAPLAPDMPGTSGPFSSSSANSAGQEGNRANTWLRPRLFT